jgi:hypothetical protein
MSDVIAKEDAEVALRSLARRYREAIAGPEGDDGWERILRTVPNGATRSALGWVVHVSAMLAAVGQALAQLPMASKPALDLAALRARRAEPSTSLSLEAIERELKSSAEMAAGALDARRGDDWERSFIVDGAPMSVAVAVSGVVHEAVRHLRDVQQTIDAAVRAR